MAKELMARRWDEVDGEELDQLIQEESTVIFIKEEDAKKLLQKLEAFLAVFKGTLPGHDEDAGFFHLSMVKSMDWQIRFADMMAQK